MAPTPIASASFVDGATRPVYVDSDGRQYVLDNDGQDIYGVWIYIDEPLTLPLCTTVRKGAR